MDAVESLGSDVGVDLPRLLLDAPEDELTSTRNAQLATFALSLAMFEEAAIAAPIDTALGHSLGEYTALAAVGILDRADALLLVDVRGSAMLEAAIRSPGGLVAMIGGDSDSVTQACAAIPGLAVANRNGPGQIVLGGSRAVIDELTERAREFGFRRAIPLKVGGAFHTPLMDPAAEPLAAALDAAPFLQGVAPVIANVDAKRHPGGPEWRDLLARQLRAPVEWEASVQSLPEGATVVEFGPTGVLVGLIKRIRDDLELRSVAVPEDLESVKDLL
jgi:[acyl-carrier-protein] S-malonyltransferase